MHFIKSKNKRISGLNDKTIKLIAFTCYMAVSNLGFNIKLFKHLSIILANNSQWFRHVLNTSYLIPVQVCLLSVFMIGTLKLIIMCFIRIFMCKLVLNLIFE